MFGTLSVSVSVLKIDIFRLNQKTTFNTFIVYTILKYSRCTINTYVKNQRHYISTKFNPKNNIELWVIAVAITVAIFRF